MRRSVVIAAFALAVAAGCGGRAAGALDTVGHATPPADSVPNGAQSLRVYELTASYRVSGDGGSIRQLVGDNEREWIQPVTGAFRIERADSLSVSNGRQSLSRQKTTQWDGPPAWATTLRTGSPDYLAERSGVVALPLLRAFLAHQLVSSAGSITRSSSEGFTARLTGFPVQVTYTVVRTMSPPQAERAHLFAIPSEPADMHETEIRPPQSVENLPIFWLGPSNDGLALARAWHQTGRGRGVTVLRYEGTSPAQWLELEESSAPRPTGGLSFGFAGRFHLADGQLVTLVHESHSAGPAWMGLAATTVWAQVGHIDLVIRSSSKQLQATALLRGLHRGS